MQKVFLIKKFVYSQNYKSLHKNIFSLVGGADKNAVVFHKDSEQIIATLKGHTKKVTSVIYHPREVCEQMHFTVCLQ